MQNSDINIVWIREPCDLNTNLVFRKTPLLGYAVSTSLSRTWM